MTGSIGGIGGKVKVLGITNALVKVRKLTVKQAFHILDAPVAGYHCVLGQDFCRTNEVGVKFKPHTVELSLGSGGSSVTVNRPLSTSKSVTVERDPSSLMCVLVKDPVDTPSTSTDPDSVPRGIGQRKGCLIQIAQQAAVAYEVSITGGDSSDEMVVSTDAPCIVPPEIQQIIEKHSKGSGPLRGAIPDNTHAVNYSCKIELKENANPVYVRQYRLTPLEKAELVKQVDAFIKKGWIEPSVSPWSSSVLFIPKPNGKLRFCVDYRGLNERSQPNRGPITIQGDLIDSLQGNTFFSALDLASGYYQLEMHEDSRKYTAFPTPHGLMQWRVMPMCLSNAPAVFQAAMNQILQVHVTAGYCVVYLDDVIIKSKSITDHAVHLDAVLTSFGASKLFCQLPKCQWALRELKYLGHIVNGQGVKADPAKVAALDRWNPPVSIAHDSMDSSLPPGIRTSARKKVVHECRRFLGFMKYFRRFIPRFSELAAPLHDQIRDDSLPWSAEATASWVGLKEGLLQDGKLMRVLDDLDSLLVTC